MHVAFIPKWYPGRNDPQLGDFLRKQAIAVSGFAKMSVLHVAPVDTLADPFVMDLHQNDGPWELHAYYRPSHSGIAPLRRGINLWRYLRAMQRAWRRMESERGTPDLVHAYILLRPVLVARWMRWHKGIPYVVSEQSSAYSNGSFARRHALYRWLGKSGTRSAAAVSAVSPWLAKALAAHGLCSGPTIIPNVVPGLDRVLPPPGTPGEVLVVADLVDPIKNVSGILRALALARRSDDRLSLTIIGDGPDREVLERLAQELHPTGVVCFLGRLANSEVLEHMAQCWAVVVNSNVETFSVVTGEALAQGKAVIATRCGGPEALVNSTNGLLIPLRDDAALAAAMLELLARNTEFQPEKIRATLGERYSTEAVGSAFHRFYQSALAHGQ